MRATKARNTNNKKDLSPEQREDLLGALKARFEKNMNRHKGLEWAEVQAKLEVNAEKLWSLNEMERILRSQAACDQLPPSDKSCNRRLIHHQAAGPCAPVLPRVIN